VAATSTRGLATDHEIEVAESMLSLLLKVVVVPDAAAEVLTGVDLGRPEYNALLEGLLAWRSTGNYDYEVLRETLPGDTRELADGLRGKELPLPLDGQLSLAVAYHLTRLRRFRLLREMKRAQDAMQAMAAEDQPAAVAQVAQMHTQQREIEMALDRLSQLVAQGGSRPISEPLPGASA
jgi:hypothetical protein